MKKFFSAMLVALLLVGTSAVAHALESYMSPINYASPYPTLSAGDYRVFSFASAPGNFLSAVLDLNITDLSSATFIHGKVFTSPPSGGFFTDTAGDYLFSSDLKLGHNSFDLANLPTAQGSTMNLLSLLNKENSLGQGINIGLYIDRGSITYNGATLNGTVAPEPISIALMGAGLVGLPFARRFRKAIS